MKKRQELEKLLYELICKTNPGACLYEYAEKIEFLFVKKTRSNNQNSYYWGVFVSAQIECFKESWGELYTPVQVHDWNKANLFCIHKNLPSGEVIKIPGSSAVKTSKEFEDCLTMGRQFFQNEFQFSIPIPNEDQLKELYQQLKSLS